MRSVAIFILLSSLAVPAFALESKATPNGSDAARTLPAPEQDPLAARRDALLNAAIRDGFRLDAVTRMTVHQPATPAKRSRSWISRHPAILGTILGAGAGALAAGTMENELFCSGGDEDCFFHGGGRVLVGAGIGAGIGALVGWMAGR